jgi:hypothetical protein
MLHTREFDVNGQKIIVGHDRETGKRYFIPESNKLFLVIAISLTDFIEGENFINIIDDKGYTYTIFWDVENPEKIVQELKSIFWIK